MELADNAQGGADASRSPGPAALQCVSSVKGRPSFSSSSATNRAMAVLMATSASWMAMAFSSKTAVTASAPSASCWRAHGHHLGQGPVQVDRRRAGRIQVLADGFESCQKGHIPALLAQRPRCQDDGISRSDTDSRSPADGQDRNRLAHVLPRMAGQIDFFKRQAWSYSGGTAYLPANAMYPFYTVNPP